MRTPTNLLTGFLGVGKTTAILNLLSKKPPEEKWAVLVNEFGEVGIDGAILEGGSPEGVIVREVGGGCFCCTTAPYLPVALHFLFTDTKPDRLLIETSGLGHPSGIIDTLRANYSDRLELRATIGIVAPADFACDGMLENPVFRDQIQMADVLILNKMEQATSQLIQDYQTWAENLFPPKLLIAATSQGNIATEWLDLSGSQEQLQMLTQLPTVQTHSGKHNFEIRNHKLPARYVSTISGREFSACGWVFHHDDVFDEEQLLALFASHDEITRLKGVFHVQHEWVIINRVGKEVTVSVTAYRRDSRLEIFTENSMNMWDEFESELLACRMSIALS